jgi:hypothetical protein
LSDGFDVMARRGANIDSDHMQVFIKLRTRICRVSNTKDGRIGTSHHGTTSLNSKVWKKLEETIQRVETNTIDYTRKQANKECLDEKCAKVNEEKNAARERTIQIKTRGAKNAYKLTWTKERHLKKAKGSSTKRF